MSDLELACLSDLCLAGAWDTYQIAEDYMLALVFWMRNYNDLSYWTITPEAGVPETVFRPRQHQVRRWAGGFLVGQVLITNAIRNSLIGELIRRKGLS